MLKVGDKAPEFCLPDQNENKVCLKDLRGKWTVLYFYPKDNTSGCTLEAVDFTSHNDNIEKIGGIVLGVSPDSTKSHTNFCNKHNLTITLLSDTEHKVLELYDAWRVKKMYGREFYGVIRSTFLIDPEGEIAFFWDKVKAKGHVEKVYEKLKELKENG